MFAILKRPSSPAAAADADSEPNISLNRQKPIGASMKFQYGNGDKPLDGYVIKRGVGSGGFGEVYFGESESGKEVALKRIQKNLEVEVRGVRHCLNLRHPNLVGIYDIKFDKDEQGWIVMEFIAGDSLRERIDRNSTAIQTQETIALFAQLAAGVAYLHDQGIVHRDLKPANVFIDGGLIKIGDYGLSKYISASRRGGQTESVGTFHYMAPEIGKGEYGKEIDIYSLGIILYEMLTGVVPFDGESSQEIILKHLTADPDVSMLPQPYAYAIQKSLAKNPASRFRDCRELLRSIGWDLDASGLAVRASGDAAHPSIPPVLQPVASAALPVAKPIGNDHPTVAGNPVMQGVYGNPGADANGVGADVAGGEVYQEPVARAIQQAFWEAQNWFRNLPPGMRGVGIAVMIIFLITNGGWIAPVAFFAFCSYVVYYIVWYLSGGPGKVKAQPKRPTNRSMPSGAFAANRPQSAQQYAANYAVQNPVAVKAQPRPAPVPYKVAFRTWQGEQRNLLKERGIWTKFHARTRSWAFSGIVIAVLSLATGLMTHARLESDATPLLGGIAWTGIMSLMTCWTVIFFARRWESQTEDSIVYRFVLMTAGVGLGAASYAISNYLQLPWEQLASVQLGEFEIGPTTLNNNNWNKAWKGFYENGSTPLLAAHVAYFASLMWIVRWWRQADVLRKSRFSLWTIAWSIAMAALVQGLFYFPAPWCLAFAGVTSFALQMASPWIGYSKTARVA